MHTKEEALVRLTLNESPPKHKPMREAHIVATWCGGLLDGGSVAKTLADTGRLWYGAISNPPTLRQLAPDALARHDQIRANRIRIQSCPCRGRTEP